jgi:hypothetical protein
MSYARNPLAMADLADNVGLVITSASVPSQSCTNDLG